MPLYRYGCDSTGNVIDVFDLPAEGKEKRGPFTCMSCGKPLSAKTAAIKKVKHFAHQNKQPSCSFATYLHKLAKQKFLETFEACRQTGKRFAVQVPARVRCSHPSASSGAFCEHDTAVWCDLAQIYDTARLESRDGQFIPDLLLSDSKDTSGKRKLYIEIFVKHRVSAQKAASGVPIIEIPVAAEEFVTNHIEKATISSQRLTST